MPFRLIDLAAALLLLLCLHPDRGTAADPPSQPDEHSTAINTAIVPASKLETDSYDWWARHNEILALKNRVNPQIVLIGDSITHFWGGPPAANHVNGPTSWQTAFGGLRVLNLGFGYDRTQNVLWRLDHGEFDGLTPRWVVINIGTNNINSTSNARGNTPDEITDAIMAICNRVKAKSPESHIILMAVFPRGNSPADPFRTRIASINEALSRAVATDPEIVYLDIGSQFFAPDGSIPRDIMGDGTHPTDKGYAIWEKALIAAGIQN